MNLPEVVHVVVDDINLEVQSKSLITQKPKSVVSSSFQLSLLVPPSDSLSDSKHINRLMPKPENTKADAIPINTKL